MAGLGRYFRNGLEPGKFVQAAASVASHTCTT